MAGITATIIHPGSSHLTSGLGLLLGSLVLVGAVTEDETVSMDDHDGGSLFAALLWMAFLSVLLFWLPALGPLIAGYVGGKKAGGVPTGILAAIIPAVVVGLLIFGAGGALGLPIISAVLGSVGFAFVAVHSFILIVGAVIGGALA